MGLDKNFRLHKWDSKLVVAKYLLHPSSRYVSQGCQQRVRAQIKNCLGPPIPPTHSKDGQAKILYTKSESLSVAE